MSIRKMEEYYMDKAKKCMCDRNWLWSNNTLEARLEDATSSGIRYDKYFYWWLEARQSGRMGVYSTEMDIYDCFRLPEHCSVLQA